MPHETQTAQQLSQKRCLPCEGGVPKLTTSEINAQLPEVPGWDHLAGPDRLQKKWTFKNFQAAMTFVNRAGQIAEDDNHHPDLHITSYKHVMIEIYTHAINGLSENDFILAAKIDQLDTPTS